MRLKRWCRLIAFSAACVLGAEGGTVEAVQPTSDSQIIARQAQELQDLRARQAETDRKLQAILEGQASPYSHLDSRVRAIETSLDTSAGSAAAEDGLKEASLVTKPDFKFAGRLFLDQIYYDDPIGFGVNRQTETGFDTARIGGSGNVYENIKYKIELEFEGEETDFKDVYVEITNLPGIGNFRVGHFKEPFSLEELTSSRFVTFMERTTPYGAFVPQRNFGVMAFNDVNCYQNATWFAGVFRGDYDDSPAGIGSERSDPSDTCFTTRYVWLPYYDEPSGGRYFVHLGGAYSYRQTTGPNKTFSGQAEAGTQGGLISATVNNDRNWHLYGLEGAVVWGAASLQSEFYSANTGDHTFTGGYAQASYFLTGEHRGYKRSSKSFDRVKPYEDAFWVSTAEGICRGRGAWELKARWSYLDLNAGDAGNRGYQDTLSAGVNWYLNPYTRLMFDLIHEDVKRVSGLSGDANIFGMRFQVDY